MPSNMLVKKQSSTTLTICLLVCFAVLTIWSSNKQINIKAYDNDEDDEEEVIPQDLIRRLTLASIEQLKQHEESYYKEFEMPNWLRTLCNSSDYNDGMSSEEVSIAMSTAIATAAADDENLSKRTLASNLPTYTFQDALESTNTFSNSVGVLLYRPENDNFVLLYGNRQLYRPKLGMGFKELTKVLRLKFPEKFQGEKSDELAIVIGGGDYPHLSKACLMSFPDTDGRCKQDETPMLNFGSTFRNLDNVLPNMIALPTPSHHLSCFSTWAYNHNIEGATQRLCPSFNAAGHKDRGSLIFGEEAGLKFEDLIPQVVWRGTDFGFLGHIEPTLGRPDPQRDIKDKIDPQVTEPKEKKAAATAELLKIYDDLIPRWKGVVLTAEAEVEAQEAQEDQQDDNVLPWANIKFTTTSPAAKDDAKAEFAKLDEYINSKGKRMSLEELAQYKYHIDIGGGGGTTWTGTIAKLAMPGLLFHHVTPTTDYFHDYKMKPWIHYVPIKADLSDLREKYEWAESHPEAAEMIASQGSDLMRYWASIEGFGEMYEDVFVDQIRQVIEAYQPVSATNPGSSWEEVLESHEGKTFEIRIMCDGKGLPAGNFQLLTQQRKETFIFSTFFPTNNAGVEDSREIEDTR